MSALDPGSQLLHYRIVERIGQGGMGQVYEAEDTKLGRRVAIKLLSPEASKNRIARERLLREARSASTLNHPNIVTIYAIDETDGMDFIVMEYVEGMTLSSMIRRGPLDFSFVLDVGAQVAGALAKAHEAGLIHRDIKPANILISPDCRAKVLDFGLAKAAAALALDANGEMATVTPDLTASGLICGTVAYMSPEQTRAEALDARSDIFSLGCVLFEAATGRLPFDGPSLLSIMHEIATAERPAPSSVRTDLPREFDVIVGRTLAKRREQRYASAGELSDALRSLRVQIADAVASAPPHSTALQPASPIEGFVGRETELRRLDEFLRSALAGSGRTVFVTGETGIGKTTLAEAFIHRNLTQHPSLVICRGRCVEQYGTGEAYLPFLDALGSLLASRGRERVAATMMAYAPTWCLQFPAAFSSSGALEQLQRDTIGATKERMLRELGDALAALSATSTLLLVLEDLQWADPSSVDLLRHLSQRAAGQRVLLVGTFRAEDAHLLNPALKGCERDLLAHKLCDVMELGALERDQIAAYLDARFAPNDFPDELTDLIHSRTEGHPLFATGFAQIIAERGYVAREGETWTLARPLAEIDSEVPGNVSSMIHKKLASLDEEDRRTLQFASVEGKEFTSTVVAALLGIDELELEERLDRLDRMHALIETIGEEELPDGELATRYNFAHALYQNVLYGDLVTKRRMVLHRQIGEQLTKHYSDQAPRIAAQLAMHFERGRDFARALEFRMIAGENATRVYANAEAERHFSRALDLVGRLPAETQAENYLAVYDRRGATNVALSRFDRASEDFTRMAECARAVCAPALECAALNSLSRALFFSHRVDEMAESSDAAMRAAERAGTAALRAETMIPPALKHVCYGELTEARALGDEIVRIARDANHKPALLAGLIRRGTVHYFQSEYECGREMMEEALALASELRDGFAFLQSHFELGLILGNLGRMSEALTLFHSATEIAKRNGDHFWLARLPNCIGWIHRELQDFEGALEHDRQGVEVARKDKILEAEANSLINLGSDFTQAGQPAQSPMTFRKVESIFERDSWFRWRYNIRLQASASEHWLAQGDFERAAEYAHRLRELAVAHDARKYVATAHKLVAEIALARGDLEWARAALATAFDLLRRYPAPLVEWRARALLGRLHARTGDSAAQRDAFTRAAEIVDGIASNVADEWLRENFLISPAVREVWAALDYKSS